MALSVQIGYIMP